MPDRARLRRVIADRHRRGVSLRNVAVLAELLDTMGDDGPEADSDFAEWLEGLCAVARASEIAEARTEMSLHVLAYNMKRALQIFGTQTLIAFIRA